MAKKPKEQEATKKGASRKSGTAASKTEARRTQKAEGSKGTKNSPAPSAGKPSPEKPKKPASAARAAQRRQEGTDSDKSTVRTGNGSQELKTCSEKAKTGPDSVDFPIVAIGASAGGHLAALLATTTPRTTQPAANTSQRKPLCLEACGRLRKSLLMYVL